MANLRGAACTVLGLGVVHASLGAVLPGVAELGGPADFSEQMVVGISRFLDAETTRVAAARRVPDDGARGRLAEMLGLIDPGVEGARMELIATPEAPARVSETRLFTVDAVRWPAIPGLFGEGLLLRPRGGVLARVVAVPDADQTPEMIAGLAPGLDPARQYARRLAESGCEVLVPTLVDRTDLFSGNPAIDRFTNQPHREWIYRQAFVLGRHPIGYEVRKILAAVDWFSRQRDFPGATVGVAGWGEGGLLAFYSAALDPRIKVALVSGYFAPRERMWREPLHRNLFGVLREFGDAEVARLILPRSLHLEHAAVPAFPGPLPMRKSRAGAAPGGLPSISTDEFQSEVERARRMAGSDAASLRLYVAADTDPPAGPMSDPALTGFLCSLSPEAVLPAPGPSPVDQRARFDFSARQERQVRGMELHVQGVLESAADVRDGFLWRKVGAMNAGEWYAAMRTYREQAWEERIGRFPTGDVPLNPRARLLHDRPRWTAHEVVLDVLPEVIAWGYLLLPKGIRPGERRPVVVTQHGVRGLPADLLNEDPAARAHQTYRAFAVRLVERGFVVFAPHNPYRGDDASRVLQRKAQPIGRTIFSIILAQHERILDFLSGLPQVDPARIGFYGLSYGGQTAMRVPVFLERYALTICSGDFNEWTRKNATTRTTKAYIYNDAYERPEFRMGLTFGYAELVALMVPRPFMVERGHDDPVADDEWVALEYAKVKRLYDRLGLASRTEIEFFNGPHTINGQGTFRFLHRHLNWPEPGEGADRSSFP